jgi:hypothetical protein
MRKNCLLSQIRVLPNATVNIPLPTVTLLSISLPESHFIVIQLSYCLSASEKMNAKPKTVS